MKKDNSSFSWQEAEKQFLQSRIVELPVSSFKKAQSAPVFETIVKTQGQVRNMVSEQLRTIYHSVWMMLDKMDYVERVQGISSFAIKSEKLSLIKSFPLLAIFQTKIAIVGVILFSAIKLSRIVGVGILALLPTLPP